MIFNSIQFLIFFGIVLSLYYNLSRKGQLFLLFVASCYFYMAFVPSYILILFLLIGIDFYLGKKIELSEGKARTRFFLLGLASNLGLLFFFKYFNFFAENVSALASLINWNYTIPQLRILLPIGLSFHIFQSISYLIEVYRGKYKAEQSLSAFGLYVMFFPQLVAGPIERPQHLLPQFHKEHPFLRENVTKGLELMLIGFFKKLVIADNLARLVDHVYRNLSSADGPLLILTLVLFAYQLYCDFSGYSDIARGSAKVLGYDLVLNFNRPYSSKSITEFWRRWHMSLSNWLRDYLYYPMLFAGTKTRPWMYFSIFTTFVLIGLWHGANWTYVMLGVTHGTYLVVGSATERSRKRLAEIIGLTKIPRIHNTLKVLISFVLVSLSWVFFRAPSLSDAWKIFSNLGTNLSGVLNISYIKKLLSIQSLGIPRETLFLSLFMILLLELVEWYIEKKKTTHIFEDRPKYLRLAWYYTLSISILAFGYLEAPSFIYFQF